jgi:hypothetical protein
MRRGPKSRANGVRDGVRPVVNRRAMLAVDSPCHGSIALCAPREGAELFL